VDFPLLTPSAPPSLAVEPLSLTPLRILAAVETLPLAQRLHVATSPVVGLLMTPPQRPAVLELEVSLITLKILELAVELSSSSPPTATSSAVHPPSTILPAALAVTASLSLVLAAVAVSQLTLEEQAPVLRASSRTPKLAVPTAMLSLVEVP